jgi:hypothetical protein
MPVFLAAEKRHIHLAAHQRTGKLRRWLARQCADLWPHLHRRSAHQIPNYLKEGVQLIDNVHSAGGEAYGGNPRYSVANPYRRPRSRHREAPDEQQSMR